MEINLTLLFAGVVAGATPILFATLGETLTEKAGLINLSLDGTILLGAMAAFAVAYRTGSLWLGFTAAAAVGGAVAAVVAVFGIHLRRSQVAVGFVLTLMCRDLAYFLGNPYARIPGPQVPPMPIPGLDRLPFAGTVLFNQDPCVYAGMLLIGLCWWYIHHTDAGLRLRAVGEHPEAAFARGIDPRRVQLVHAVIGGCLVGIAGAVFSLSVKPGWGRPQGAEGTGWIALALVIFGGWSPVKAAAGAYFFAFLQVIGIYLQGWFPSVPAQVFQVAPFPLMIFTLLIIAAAQKESLQERAARHPVLKRLIEALAGSAPAALGRPYGVD